MIKKAIEWTVFSAGYLVGTVFGMLGIDLSEE